MKKDDLLTFWHECGQDVKSKMFFHTEFKKWIDQQEDAPEATESTETGVKAKSDTRTQSQHNSLFLWFSMIEHEAQNAGITWNQVVGKTHQLKITKEGLHVMAKQLAEALWGIKSTKDLKKTGHIDDLVDHFVDLFSKVGLELPLFPNDESKGNDLIKAMDKANNLSYPVDEYPGGPNFDV